MVLTVLYVILPALTVVSIFLFELESHVDNTTRTNFLLSYKDCQG